MLKSFLLALILVSANLSYAQDKNQFTDKYNKQIFFVYALKGAGAEKDVYKTYKELSERMPFANYALSGMYYSGKAIPLDREKAQKLKIRAANQGYVLAQIDLLMESRPSDLQAQLQTLQKAASSGDPIAQLFLADHFLEGNGLPQDPQEAKLLVEKSIKTRYCDQAFSELLNVYWAQIYEQGLGTTKDPAFAAQITQKAANCGDPEAMVRMGKYLWKGFGIPQDNKAAIEMFNMAIAIGGDTSGGAVIRFLKQQQALDVLRSQPKPSPYGWRIGMTKDEVLASSKNKPLSTYTYTTASGVREQWIYAGIVSSYAYLFFGEDGRLTSYFESSP